MSILSNSKCKLSYFVRRSQILDIIRDKGEVSRKELVRLTKLTAPVVTRITKKLIEENIIEEAGVDITKGSGRPEVRLRLSTSSKYIFGIDMGTYEIKAAVTNFANETIHTISRLTPRNDSPEVLDATLCQIIKELMAVENITIDQIEGIAFCTGGRIDNEAGRVENCNNPAMNKISLRELAKRACGDVPVIVASALSSRVLSEVVNSELVEARDILVVHCGYGIGLSPMAGDKVILGFTPVPKRDFGHITFDCTGPVCHCGLNGCIEAFASGWAIERDAKANPSPRLLEIVEGNTDIITAKEVAIAADDGDSFCQSILTRAGRILGRAASMFIQYYAPQRIIFTGGLVKPGTNPLYYNSVLEELSRNMLAERFSKYQINPTTLDKFAGAVGATRIFLNERVHGPLEPILERIW